MSENKPDTVPGLGFKDEEKAHETLQILKGRDPDYQKLAVKGLIGRAKRVLTLTKDKDKLQNIKNAMKIFDDWLVEYENSNLSKENRPYLPLDTMKLLRPLAEKHKLENNDSKAFFKAYEKVKGEYKNLRTVDSIQKDVTWDILRNKQLKPIMKKFKDEDPNLWEGALPTKAHMEMIIWSYSPDAARIKKNLSTLEEKLGRSKDDEQNEEESSSDDSIDNRADKRKSSASSGSDSDESPKKKSKK